jgi:DNA-binding ferritin-like protein
MNPQEVFLKLVAHLMLMRDYVHSCHHDVAKILFFQDHSALGDFYEELEDELDRSGEKYVSLYGAYDIKSLFKYMSAKISSLPSGEPSENKAFFIAILGLEKELGQMVDILVRQGGYSEGCKNLIADIGSKSESRQYKIKRRLM